MDAYGLCIIFNFSGFILSAATAYIYEFVHQAENIEEKCIVHLSASFALTEFVIFINVASGYSRYSLIEDAAQITTTFALSSFLWSLILAFHLKKKFTPGLGETSKKSKLISNDSKLMKKYLLIGYGIPFLVFTSYLGGLNHRSKNLIMQLTILADILIIILDGLIFFNVSTNLLRQIDNAQASLKNNDPVKVDIKQLKCRQQFVYRLFQILVIPWLTLLMVFIVVSTMTRFPGMKDLVLIGPTVLIGSQGLGLFINLVVHRKRIWKDLGSEYGWKKPDELTKLEEIWGYISEDDDEEKVMNSKTRWDLLAKIHYTTVKNKPTKKEANQQANPEVTSKREVQNMEPAIHQYIGCGVSPGGVDPTDATKKLINEMV